MNSYRAKQILKQVAGITGLLPSIQKMRIRLRRKRLDKIYEQHISRIKNKEVIRVLFLVSENSKWCSQSLYDAFQKDNRFDPFIVIARLARPGQTIDKDKQEYDENIHFFKTREMTVYDGYDFNELVDTDLRIFSPDIVFYQQPWEIAPLHDVEQVSQYALTCYNPYGFLIGNLEDVHYNTIFQQYMWITFAFSEEHRKLFRKYAPLGDSNVIAVNYPKLDVYLEDLPSGENFWPRLRSDNIKRVIWAPHFAYNSGIMYGTFDWNYQFMLDLARKHQNIDWIVKPHPRLRSELVYQNTMTLEEVNSYFKEWQDLPNAKLYEQGEYFKVMMTSDAMITDCGSFLAEYLPTQKPILHLINPSSVGFNEIGRKIIKDFYKINNIAELSDTIDEVIVNKNDYLKNTRADAINIIVIPGQSGSDSIKSIISDVLTKNSE